MYRQEERQIKDWIFSKEKTALLLTGARQVGKTFLIRQLLKQTGADYVEFNLIEQPGLIPLFESAKFNETGAFLARLSVATDQMP